ncbi:MAG: hypothetical protein OHK0038_23660 [Flammeovirgaceae bacterium]
MRLSENQKSFVYYRGGEVLKYKNQHGSQMVFMGKGRVVSTEKWNTTAKESCEYYEVETDVSTFESEGNYKLEFKLLASDSYQVGKPNEYFILDAYFEGDEYSQTTFNMPECLRRIHVQIHLLIFRAIMLLA